MKAAMLPVMVTLNEGSVARSTLASSARKDSAEIAGVTGITLVIVTYILICVSQLAVLLAESGMATVFPFSALPFAKSLESSESELSEFLPL